MNIRPLHDRVVVKRKDNETKSKGGIYLPDSATEKPLLAEVVAVGPGKTDANNNVKMLSVKAGDTVLIGKYSGTEVTLDEDELVVLKEDDILGIVE